MQQTARRQSEHHVSYTIGTMRSRILLLYLCSNVSFTAKIASGEADRLGVKLPVVYPMKVIVFLLEFLYRAHECISELQSQ